MNKTFQSYVFGCRVNEAERIKLDKELVEAGYTVDLASPSFLVINTCAITGKAEREAKQLVYQLRKRHPEAKIVLTGCSTTLWQKYQTADTALGDIIVPNDKKSSLVSLLAEGATFKVAGSPARSAAAAAAEGASDKFRYSNRLLVKIQDGCQRFCSYCIVPYLRGLPQSQSIRSIVTYINSFDPLPAEVVLSAINTEAFGIDSGESFIDLIKAVLTDTRVPRLAFGSIHPWSLTNEFLEYYRTTLSKEPRFIHFFHVPIQSGSQMMLNHMKREYVILDVIRKLNIIKKCNPHALIATDVIVGFLGETDDVFNETLKLLKASPINRFHVFKFSNRPHTAAYYKKEQLQEPDAQEKKDRSQKLITLSKVKYDMFLTSEIGRSSSALAISHDDLRTKILLDNHSEGVIAGKQYLPGELVHVTIIAAKDGK